MQDILQAGCPSCHADISIKALKIYCIACVYVEISVYYLFIDSITKKTAHLIFTVFGGKMAREPRKKPLDFGDNRDQVLLGLVLW